MSVKCEKGDVNKPVFYWMPVLSLMCSTKQTYGNISRSVTFPHLCELRPLHHNTAQSLNNTEINSWGTSFPETSSLHSETQQLKQVHEDVQAASCVMCWNIFLVLHSAFWQRAHLPAGSFYTGRTLWYHRSCRKCSGCEGFGFVHVNKPESVSVIVTSSSRRSRRPMYRKATRFLHVAILKNAGGAWWRSEHCLSTAREWKPCW